MMMCTSSRRGTCASIRSRNSRNCAARCRWWNWVITSLVLGVEGRKQRGRPVSCVVVGPTLNLARQHREQGLRPVERLNLRLLIDAEHGRMGRRIQIQPDNVANFLHQQRIVRELERLAAMRLQPERVPNPA